MRLTHEKGFSAPSIGMNKEKRKEMKQKLKTHRAMAKRVKVTGNGKLLRRKAAINHLRRNKSPQLVRAADKMYELSAADQKSLKRLLPYAF